MTALHLMKQTVKRLMVVHRKGFEVLLVDDFDDGGRLLNDRLPGRCQDKSFFPVDPFPGNEVLLK